MRLGSRVYVSTYVTTLFIQGCTVLQGMILARMLGPEGRGEFAAILLWPSVFATIGLMGIHFVLARRAGKGGDTSFLIRDSIVVSLITGIITAIVFLLFVPYLIPGKNQYLLSYIYIYCLFIPIFQLRTNIAAIDQGKGNFKYLNLSRAILYPIFFMGLIWTWFFAEDRLLGTLIALLIGNGTVIVFRLIIAGRLNNLGTLSLPTFKLFCDGIPYQLTIFLQMATQYVDQVILLWLLNPIDLAMYVVARSSASVIGSLPTSLGLISLSQATRLDRETGFRPLAQMLRRGFILVILLAACFAPLFQLLIPIIYGNDFRPAIPLAIYVITGVIASGFAGIIEEALRGHGIPLSSIIPRGVGVIILIIAAITAVPKYGVAAIAIGFSFSQIVVLFLFVKTILSYFNNTDTKYLIPNIDDFKHIISRLMITFNFIKK